MSAGISEPSESWTTSAEPSSTNGLSLAVEPDVHTMSADVEVEDPRHLLGRATASACPSARPHWSAGHACGRPRSSRDRCSSHRSLQPCAPGSSWLTIRSMSGILRKNIDPRIVGPRNVRADRLSPGAEHQLVVGLPVDTSVRSLAHFDDLGHGVDAHDIVSGAHIQGQRGGEALRGLEEQATAMGISPPCGKEGRSWQRKRSGLRSRITISAESSSRRTRAPVDAPAATPPTITTFILTSFGLRIGPGGRWRLSTAPSAPGGRGQGADHLAEMTPNASICMRLPPGRTVDNMEARRALHHSAGLNHPVPTHSKSVPDLAGGPKKPGRSD